MSTGESEWVSVGSSVAATYVFDAAANNFNSSVETSLAYYVVNVNSTLFPDGPVQLKVVADTAAFGELTAMKSSTIANTGIPLCYTTSDQGGQYPLHVGNPYTFTVADCSTDAASIQSLYGIYKISSVSFYKETLARGVLSSKLISSTVTAPFSFQTIQKENMSGKRVTFKAVVKSETRIASKIVYMTSTTMTGIVQPTPVPSSSPSTSPSSQPTPIPSSLPSSSLSLSPSSLPSSQPSSSPSASPSRQPTPEPSSSPSSSPSSQPTPRPSSLPSSSPSRQPTPVPSSSPSSLPSSQPTAQSLSQTTSMPSLVPSSSPSSSPSSQPTPKPYYLLPSSSPLTLLTPRPSGIICIKNNSFHEYLDNLRPNITYIEQSKNGDAVGGEPIKLFGYQLGRNTSIHGVVINDAHSWKTCEMASLKSTLSFVQANNLMKRVIPYVQCVTTSTTVGWKNVTLFVDSFVSLPYGKYRVTCKAGTYGHEGELCTSCVLGGVNGTSISGMSCPYDNMKDPIALPGKYSQLLNLRAFSSFSSSSSPSSSCSCSTSSSSSSSPSFPSTMY